MTLSLQVIDAGNAVPVFLAATAHSATQLSAVCEYWMAADLAAATQNEQWGALSDQVRARVSAEHARLEAARVAQRAERRLAERLPCLLAPVIASEAAP